MAYDPRGDASNLMAYDPNYKPVTGTGGDPRVAGTQAAQEEHLMGVKKAADEDAEIWGSGYSKRKSAEQIARMQGYAAENVASIGAGAQRDVARIRAAAGSYNQGGTVKDPRASRRHYAKGGPIFR